MILNTSVASSMEGSGGGLINQTESTPASSLLHTTMVNGENNTTLINSTSLLPNSSSILLNKSNNDMHSSIVTILVTSTVLSVLIVGFTAYCLKGRLNKRRYGMHHRPIIEYKEDNISVSGFSTGGYGTCEDLENGYLTADLPSKISGNLSISLFDTRKETYIST